MPAPELTNMEIADALSELGDLYELDGAIVHRVLAYRGAAKSVREAPVSVAALALQGRASELAGIGATL
jgi:DNA polymerase (family 10)